MGSIVAGWIVSILQNYISELVLDGKEGVIKKWKHNRFLKKLNQVIIDFCSKNECYYLDSSAFEYFIRSTDFLNKIVERAVVVRVDESDIVFRDSWIRKAREIANKEGIAFSTKEEGIIKDLWNIIDEEVKKYYNQKLSIEQRRVTAIHLRDIAELKEQLEGIKNQSQAQSQEVLKVINNLDTIGESNAELLSNILIADIWEGRIKEFEDLALAIKDKSSDLKKLYDCIRNTFIIDADYKILDTLEKIENITIRDNAIRAMMPIVFYKNKTVEKLSRLVTGGSLKTIVNSIESGDFSCIFTDSISNSSGLEIHNFELNKKLVCEEEWLVKQIAVVYIYQQKIFNTSTVMKDLAKGVETWFTQILISDKYIDSLLVSKNCCKTLNEVSLLSEKLKKDEPLYMGLVQIIRVLYIGIQAKAMLASGKYLDVENLIPDNLKDVQPLSDYVYMVRIEKDEIEIDELYDYCNTNQTYWLLNNYFIKQRDESKLINYCLLHEQLLLKDGPLFFMFLGALRSVGDKEKCIQYLDKYSTVYEKFYEYWNEKLHENGSENEKKQFVEICQDGKMQFVFRASIYLLIERLLNYQMYSEAEIYIRKAELFGESDSSLMKYRGVIEQGRGRHLEAIKYYYKAFQDNPEDAYVIDSIIVLSFANKRKVKEEVILSAEKVGTSRLHSLAAECYIRNGNRTKAEVEIIKSILLSKDNEYNPVFGQYVQFHSSSKIESTRIVKGIDADTVAYCVSKDGKKKCLCIYESRLLPSSPCYWNGDYHIYMDEAAGLDYIRKHNGDWIKIEDVDYQIKKIAPLDFYYFRVCMSKMKETGVAKEIFVPIQNGKMDIQAFNEQIIKYSPDEKKQYNWLEQYSNLDDVPLPLYAYKRFTRCNYLKFIDMLFTTSDFFVREISCPYVERKKYIVSFSALIMLYKIGVSSEKLKDAGSYITTSTREEIENDVADIIREYDRDTVATMGVFNGQVFINETGDAGKAFWIKEAGNIKKYCKSIPVLESNNDLGGDFFDSFDSKELFGICDYDAIAIVNNCDEFSLVSMEAIFSLLHQSTLVKLNVISLVDFLIWLKPDVTEFIEYLSKLMDNGCLMSISRNAIVYISDYVKSAKKSNCEKIYSSFEDLLKRIDNYPEKNRLVAIQALTESFGQLQDVVSELEHNIFQILISNMLLLRKQKLQLQFDNQGNPKFIVTDINI